MRRHASVRHWCTCRFCRTVSMKLVYVDERCSCSWSILHCLAIFVNPTFSAILWSRDQSLGCQQYSSQWVLLLKFLKVLFLVLSHRPEILRFKFEVVQSWSQNQLTRSQSRSWSRGKGLGSNFQDQDQDHDLIQWHYAKDCQISPWSMQRCGLEPQNHED